MKKVPLSDDAALRDATYRAKPGDVRTTAIKVSRDLRAHGFRPHMGNGVIVVKSRDTAFEVNPKIAAQCPNYPVVYVRGVDTRTEMIKTLHSLGYVLAAHGIRWISVLYLNKEKRH